MEQMDIPSVLVKGIENMGMPIGSPEAIEAMQNVAKAGNSKDTVLDQFGNTIFITSMKTNKNKIRIALTSMYNADTPRNMVRNVLEYLKTLKKRRVGLLFFTMDDENLMPLMRVIGKIYPIQIKKDPNTGSLSAQMKLLGAE
tara:strand:- start:3910 stop:4335 length:426 start_codon:yes stop_codon:yes gene_type:complete